MDGGREAHRETIEKRLGEPPDLKSGTVYQPHRGNVNKTRYALLTDDQALFIGNLSRNTEAVVRFKAALLKAFSAAQGKRI